ncbi:hypothetical protein ACFPXP_21215 [Marinicrinis lubricantis]|uniref:Lactobin A/cerein 7B family class IIb bacteriocin n=1 Tax=Marinicrinis lubricantis TaxID=2086470 RepID=A0ABW1IV25_9BACL
MKTNGFSELNELEMLDTNGGGIWAVAGAFVVGIIANEVVERTTGSDIPTHIGDGLSYIGGKLNELGEKIQFN